MDLALFFGASFGLLAAFWLGRAPPVVVVTSDAEADAAIKAFAASDDEKRAFDASTGGVRKHMHYLAPAFSMLSESKGMPPYRYLWLTKVAEPPPEEAVEFAELPCSPLRESDAAEGTSALSQRFAEDGYLFFRGALEELLLFNLRRALFETVQRILAPGTDVVEGIFGAKEPMFGPQALQRLKDYETMVSSEHYMAVRTSAALQAHVALLFEQGATLRIIDLHSPRLIEPHGPTTRPHQDYNFNRWRTDFVTAWVPLVNMPTSMGGLALVRDSHKRGKLEHDDKHERLNWVDVSKLSGPVEWLSAEFRMSDVLLFSPLMLHSGLLNRTDRIRASVDFRFAMARVISADTSGGASNGVTGSGGGAVCGAPAT